jgi:hypothetical protein
MVIFDAAASREFLISPHITPFREVTVVEDLICAMTSSGNGWIDMAPLCLVGHFS